MFFFWATAPIAIACAHVLVLGARPPAVNNSSCLHRFGQRRAVDCRTYLSSQRQQGE